MIETWEDKNSKSYSSKREHANPCLMPNIDEKLYSKPFSIFFLAFDSSSFNDEDEDDLSYKDFLKNYNNSYD